MLYLPFLNLEKKSYKVKIFSCFERKKKNYKSFKTFQHRAKISIIVKYFETDQKQIYGPVNIFSGRNIMTVYTRRKISIANKGKKRSVQTKKKISLSLTGRKLSNNHKINLKSKLTGENNPRFGKKHSKYSKRKISLSNFRLKILKSYD
jgi:hypothetical protein